MLIVLTRSGRMLAQVTVAPPTASVRPYIVCAVLRDCTLGERAYNSFLDLQEALHHNIARRCGLEHVGPDENSITLRSRTRRPT